MPYVSKINTSVDGVVPVASNLLGVCSTGASTASKVVTMSDFDVLIEGVTIHVYFQYANTASNPTMQVGSTSAKAIYTNGVAGGDWKAGGICSFTYYGGHWVMNDVQDGGASTDTFVTQEDTSTNANYRMLLSKSANDTTETETSRKSGKITFNPNTGMRTISDGNQRLSLNDYHSIELKRALDTYFDVRDMVDSSGYTTVNERHTVTSDDLSFNTGFIISNISSVKVNGTATTNYTLNGRTITIGSISGDSATVDIVYTTNSAYARYLLFGKRAPNTNIGAYSVALGYNVDSSGEHSYAEGFQTSATGKFSHAEGSHSVASGDRSHSESTSTASGAHSHAEGRTTTASGNASHSEGGSTVASGVSSHSEGERTSATNTGSHSEGYETVASGEDAHSEGYFTEATGSNSHSEGHYAKATGTSSHAEGASSIASGDNSHAQNRGTIAQRKSQTVIGEYNVADNTGSSGLVRGDYALIIGNGTDDNNRSNALTVEWDGDVNIPAGASYKVNGVPIADTDTTYTMSISGDTLTLTPSSGSPQSITLPDDDTTYTLTKSGSTITLTGSDGSTTSVTDDDTILQYVEDAPDVGGATNNVLLNDVANNTATGGYSLAQNLGTKASSANQTAIGKYNIEDTSDTYALIIGNGTADNARSNAFTVDWSGNVTTPARVNSDAVRTRYVSSKNGYHAMIWVDLSSNWNVNYPSGMNYDGTLTQSSTDKEWMQSVVKSICAKYPNITNAVFRGQIYPNSRGFFEIFIYDTSALANGYPVCVGTFRKYSTNLYTFSTNNNGVWSWKTNVTTALTKTWTSQNYVTEESFNRMNCYDIGNAYVVHGNLQITAGVPVGQSITIGKFTFPEVNAVAAGFQQTPIGTGSGSLNMTVEANGDVKIYNYGSSATGGGWARFSIVLAHV